MLRTLRARARKLETADRDAVAYAFWEPGQSWEDIERLAVADWQRQHNTTRRPSVVRFNLLDVNTSAPTTTREAEKL